MFLEAEFGQGYEFHPRRTVSEWTEIFRKGRTSVTVVELSERPSISARDERLEEARALVIQDRRVPNAELVQKLEVVQVYRIQQYAAALGSSLFV
jgi:hypothetical protein